MSRSDLTQLKSDLADVRSAISRYLAGKFEVRRGERSFAMPSLKELRTQEHRLIRAIQRCEGNGSTFQGVPSERYREYGKW